MIELDTEAMDTLNKEHVHDYLKDKVWGTPYHGSGTKHFYLSLPIAPWWMRSLLVLVEATRIDNAEDAGYIEVKSWWGKLYVTGEVKG